MPGATKQTAEDFIGIDMLYYAKITADTDEGLTYDTPKPFAPVAELSKTTTAETVNSYYDNGIYRTLSSESQDEYTINTPALDLATLAEITGKNIDAATSAFLDSGEPETVYFALLFRAQLSDYTYRYYAINKCSFAVPDETITGKGESIEPQGQELTVTSVRSQFKYEIGGQQKGIKRIIADERDGKVDFTKWFTAVPVPNAIPTVTDGGSGLDG